MGRLAAIARRDKSRAPMGDIIHVGEVQLQVTQEVNPCFRMDEQCPGLKDRLTPDRRGGVACIVLQGGRVAVGDEVSLATAENGASQA